MRPIYIAYQVHRDQGSITKLDCEGSSGVINHPPEFLVSEFSHHGYFVHGKTLLKEVNLMQSWLLGLED
jgi:hypothetical protein